ncbi:MAG: histidyl-tRNA synthetase [Acidimicrobiales bacterium]|jgi:histidyl-tRNA synthetase
MTNKGKLTTESYKGVRDFYPEDMAEQRYMFDMWSMTAEHFGFERYDASVLEPAELYKSKTSTEIVNEQTYTFSDRGNREVTLRPEMTPTVARMIARRYRDLSFPVRWYSIPNLFRYERTQRGRLREHWQLNCDIFGVDDISADIEIILLANEIFKNFGAVNGKHYEIHISSRRLLDVLYDTLNIDGESRLAATRLADRKNKMEVDEFKKLMTEAVGINTSEVLKFLNADNINVVPEIIKKTEAFTELQTLITTIDSMDCAVIFDPTIIRGFDYYTGIVFEIIDLHPENNRSMMGGGRYDNLTELFGGEPIPGIGFGFGDVTLRDFLISHDLMTTDITAPTLSILPTEVTHNLEAQKIAQAFREAGVSTSVDLSSKKVGKKISLASERFIHYVLVLGEDEIQNKTYTMKNLMEDDELSGTLEELIEKLSN